MERSRHCVVLHKKSHCDSLRDYAQTPGWSTMTRDPLFALKAALGPNHYCYKGAANSIAFALSDPLDVPVFCASGNDGKILTLCYVGKCHGGAHADSALLPL